MSEILTAFIPGKPAPQGSKRHVGRGIMVESSKEVAPWRESVRWGLLGQLETHNRGQAIESPIAIELEFVMPRPASAPKRSTPPAVKRPDLDKLARAVLDAVGSAGVWRDDSQVVRLVATKRLAEIGEVPGVHIVMSEAGEMATGKRAAA